MTSFNVGTGDRHPSVLQNFNSFSFEVSIINNIAYPSNFKVITSIVLFEACLYKPSPTSLVLSITYTKTAVSCQSCVQGSLLQAYESSLLAVQIHKPWKQPLLAQRIVYIHMCLCLCSFCLMLIPFSEVRGSGAEVSPVLAFCLFAWSSQHGIPFFV